MIRFALCLLFSVPVWALDVSVKQVNNKRFLELPSEASPNDMIWGESGAVIETYLGIPAYSNGAAQGQDRIYQCTELVHRFLNETWGIPTRMGLGTGMARVLPRALRGTLQPA